MADNFLHIPFLCPVKFYEVGYTQLPTFQTPHFDDYKFEDRLLPWQGLAEDVRTWQNTDIIHLQFTSSFDPIVVELINEEGEIFITLPALIGLPNKFIPGTFSFQVSMSLAGLSTDCYRLRITAGAAGPFQKVYLSNCQYISDEVIPNTLLIEYWNSRYHEDVIFETGIKFQMRIYGHLGFLDPGRNDERYRDQRYNPALLNSRTLRQWPVYFGNEHGLSDDVIDLLNRIWSCDNVLIDNKAFGVSDNSKFEFTGEDYYPKRGVKMTVEEGINRNSKIFTVETDPTKKMMVNLIVEAKVFGDLSNSGSNNTIPVINVE